MDTFIALASGVVILPWWGYVLVALGLTHITITGVTIFLHRHQAHRALELHPISSHFFRFWLWLTTGMVTKEWAAVHRKHHAKVETPDDPHSPQIVGLRKVLLEGSELYRDSSSDKETLEKYGRGTPDDWIEHHLYSKHSVMGVAIMMVIDLALFGFYGLTIWAVQMAWIPIFAAGIINGLGHHTGYRSFHPDDASTNIVPWGILIGGEELHNNHHAYATSAQLSNQWFEFDIGWMYIRLMELCGLATVKHRAPRLYLAKAANSCDEKTLRAVIDHRFRVAKKLATLLKTQLKSAKVLHQQFGTKRLMHLFDTSPGLLSTEDHAALKRILDEHSSLVKAYTLRHELPLVWAKSMDSIDLVPRLEKWCKDAEASGIIKLEKFSRKLRRYRSAA